MTGIKNITNGSELRPKYGTFYGNSLEGDQTPEDIVKTFALKFEHLPDAVYVLDGVVWIPRRLCPRCDAPTKRGGDLCGDCLPL